MKQLNKMLAEFDSKGVFPYDKELSEVAKEKNGLDSEYGNTPLESNSANILFNFFIFIL